MPLAVFSGIPTGAAEEIIGRAVGNEAACNELKKRISDKFGMNEKEALNDHLNKARNWLKHWTDKKDNEYIELELEKEAIQYIQRTITNLLIHDYSATSETPRFIKWIRNNKKELIEGLPIELLFDNFPNG